MRYPNLNVFAAWFFIMQTLAMDSLAAIGHSVLEMLGASTPEGAAPGSIVGALLLFGVIFMVQYFRGSLPPQGKPEGSGYILGHRLMLAGNVLAAGLFVFSLFAAGIGDHNAHVILEKFSIASGYIAMACWAVGFSLIYQSALPQEKH
jgi:hypothetical protein